MPHHLEIGDMSFCNDALSENSKKLIIFGSADSGSLANSLRNPDFEVHDGGSDITPEHTERVKRAYSTGVLCGLPKNALNLGDCASRQNGPIITWITDTVKVQAATRRSPAVWEYTGILHTSSYVVLTYDGADEITGLLVLVEKADNIYIELVCGKAGSGSGSLLIRLAGAIAKLKGKRRVTLTALPYTTSPTDECAQGVGGPGSLPGFYSKKHAFEFGDRTACPMNAGEWDRTAWQEQWKAEPSYTHVPMSKCV